MTVSFPSSQPANTPPANKPADTQTLQNAFAVLLRSYGTEKTGTSASMMLEILQPTSQKDNAIGEDRNQQRREHQQHVDRNDFTKFEQKRQDKSEIRNGEMNVHYQDRLVRKETLQNDYQARIERNDQQPAIRAEISKKEASVPPPLNVAQPNESVPNQTHLPPPQNNVSEIAGVNNQTLPANVVVPNNTATAVQAGMLMPGSNLPMPIQTTPQIAGAQTFTLFTPSGRFGQIQNKADERETEDEEPVEGKSVKKKQPFAVFEAIHAEALRATRKILSQQPKELPSHAGLHRITGKPTREKPKEAEPDQPRSVKTLDELLNKPEQNVSVPKKGEPNQSNQTQYLNRIAAACEAAAQYAPIRMKINLDHLGTLTLRFFYKADKLTLRFETPSEESERFIHEHLGGLRAILSRRKVNIVDIEIWREG